MNKKILHKFIVLTMISAGQMYAPAGRALREAPANIPAKPVVQEKAPVQSVKQPNLTETQTPPLISTYTGGVATTLTRLINVVKNLVQNPSGATPVAAFSGSIVKVSASQPLTQLWMSPVFNDGSYCELGVQGNAAFAPIAGALQQGVSVIINFTLAASNASATMVATNASTGAAISQMTFAQLGNTKTGSGNIAATATITGLNISYQTQDMSNLGIVNLTANQPFMLQPSLVSGVTGQSQLIKPTRSKTSITIQPSAGQESVPATTKVVAIPAAVTAIEVYASTNVGNLYTEFSFKPANIQAINTALATGKSLQFGLNVQQNNQNYNVTGTVYDLQNNVIAQEVRQNVVNKSAASNTANVATGAPITSAAGVFTYYDIDIAVQSGVGSIEANNMSLASSVVLAASAQAIQVTSPLKSMAVTAATAVANLSTSFNLSVQNILDINKALAAGGTITFFVEAVANAASNWDLVFTAYNAQGVIVAQEARSSVINKATGTNSANIASGAVIPTTAGQFVSTNFAIEFLNNANQENIENLPLSSVLSVQSQLAANSIVQLPSGVDSLNAIGMTAQFGSVAAPTVDFTAANFALINGALDLGQAVGLLCEIQNGEIVIAAYNAASNTLICMENYAVPANAQAANFSGYQLIYLTGNQSVGTQVPANQTITCTAGQCVMILPELQMASVTSSMQPGANGATAFTGTPAPTQTFIGLTEQPYNANTPLSVAGGLKQLSLLRVQLADANYTALLTFDFTTQNGLQYLTQEVLNNGLYITFALQQGATSGQYNAIVQLEDAQENVYAMGSAPVNTQMVYGWIGCNMQTEKTTQTSTTTYVHQVPLLLNQSVLYRQQLATSAAQ